MPRYNVEPRLADDDDFRRRIDASVATLKQLLEDGNIVYGMFPPRPPSHSPHTSRFVLMRRPSNGLPLRRIRYPTHA